MGRLFWKFFFFVWLAQLTTVLGVTAFFSWKHQQRESRWEKVHAPASADTSNPNTEPGKLAAPIQQKATGEQPAPSPRHRKRPPGPIEPLIGGFLASLVFAALLARYFSKPIRTLRSAFDAAALGDLDVRVGSAMGGRRDELAELGKDFDRMTTQLQTLVEGQRRLLHDVSHELRSPLARLQVAIGLARQQPAKLEVSLERIERESMRMDRLVGQLLTLSRLEAGTAGGRVDEIEVMELLSGIIADARFEAGNKNVEIELTGDCEGVIAGDGELLHRAIENVTRNAIRYSPPGAPVKVDIQTDAVTGELRIAVRDNGPGVAEGDLESIFIPFFRSTSPKDNDGHGLGLAIARRVVESIGGRIRAVNRAEGGLSMEIALPVGHPGR